jgi:hypothetical protein
MLNFFKRMKDTAPALTAVRVRSNSNGFLYRDRTGELQRALPGEVVTVDEATLAAIRHRVELVVK